MQPYAYQSRPIATPTGTVGRCACLAVMALWWVGTVAVCRRCAEVRYGAILDDTIRNKQEG